MTAQAGSTTAAVADGVICFGGEDWWYHNRGHFDMQMMRELSRMVPVLYVNSIGMRVPRPAEGAMFLKRVRRKVRSMRRGLVRVRENFAVLSPIAAPGRMGRILTARVMPRQVARAARSIGICKPVVWIACPPAALALEHLDHVGLVYQRTDKFEEFPFVDRKAIERLDQDLKQQATVTLFCSPLLYERERDDCRDALFVDHGVDYERFAEAGRDVTSVPSDVRNLARPRVGFIGGIDAHTFDPPLFEAVVDRCVDLHFVLVGASSLPVDWLRDRPNVTFLGQKLYDDVPAYMAACDVLIMPWNRSEWIRACNPIKLKEYLATGRPVVSTSYDELLRTWREHVSVADGADAFAAAIREALARPGNADLRRERVRQETWSARAADVLARLDQCGVRLAAQDAHWS